MEAFGQFRIMHIIDRIERRFGKVYKTEEIKANPVITDPMMGMKSFVPILYEGTKTFLVPLSMLDSIISIAQMEQLWEPSTNDYIEQTIEDNGEIITIFRHTGCYGFEPFLDYRVNGVTFNEDGSNVCNIPEEHWTFEGGGVITPHGCIRFNSIKFIEDYKYSGVEFGVSESLRFNEIEYSNNRTYNKVPSRIRLVRRQNGKIIWFSMYDYNNTRIASFRGYDCTDYDQSDYFNTLKSGLNKYLDDLYYSIKKSLNQNNQKPAGNNYNDLPF